MIAKDWFNDWRHVNTQVHEDFFANESELIGRQDSIVDNEAADAHIAHGRTG